MVFAPYTLPQEGRFRQFRSLFSSQSAKCRLRRVAPTHRVVLLLARCPAVRNRMFRTGMIILIIQLTQRIAAFNLSVTHVHPVTSHFALILQ